MPRSHPLLAFLFVLVATAARAQTAPAETPAPVTPAAPAAPAPAPATAASGASQEPGKEASVVAVLSFESNEAGQDSAPGVTSFIASRLAESPRVRVLSQHDLDTVLDAERQRQLLGVKACESGACLQQLSSITGARYVITGRLDRFGGQYLLTASLVDTVGGRSLARPRAEAPTADALLRTAEAVADQLLAALVTPEGSASGRPLLGDSKAGGGGGGFSLGLRINNNFIERLSNFNPGLDLELGYWFHPEWLFIAQVGFSYVRSGADDPDGGLNVLPSIIGARHYHRVEKPLRPYWGFGLGVQLSFGDFGIFQSTGPLPTVVGFLGLEYLIAGRVGVQLEAGTNIAQAVLGLADSKLGDGLNLDLNAGIAYHF